MDIELEVEGNFGEDRLSKPTSLCNKNQINSQVFALKLRALHNNSVL